MLSSLLTLSLPLFLATTSFASVTLNIRQSTPSNLAPCAPLHIVVLRGLNQNNADPDLYQFQHDSANDIVAAIPGSTSTGLPYNAGDPNPVDAINNGTVMLQDYVESYVAACPASKLGILGYSDGATAVSNAICGTASLPYIPTLPLQERYAQNVVATVVWGDLTRAPEQPWNQGTCPAYMPGITARVDTRGCAPFASGYQNYCDSGDNFCCSSPTEVDGAHHTYQWFYTNSTADWVVGRYRDSTQST